MIMIVTKSSNIKYSICSLCRDASSVSHLSCIVRDIFPGESELLMIDNSSGEWDCYSAIRYFVRVAQGDLIVIIHDDVEFGTLPASLLLDQIQEITIKDETAVLFGIAGISNKDQRGIGHFYDACGEQLWGGRYEDHVSSLDECFLVIKRGMGLIVSEGLNGYHFYGTDLCLNAMEAKLSCHVIDYPLIHKSAGSINENFFEARDRFGVHLENQGVDRFVRTTCTVLYGGKSRLKHCLALALSHILLETPRHRDYDLASRCIINRGIARYGWFWFSLMILICRLHSRWHRLFNDMMWWTQNWRDQLNVKVIH